MQHILSKLFLPTLIGEDGRPKLFGNDVCARGDAAKDTVFETKVSNVEDLEVALYNAGRKHIINPRAYAPSAPTEDQSQLSGDAECFQILKNLNDVHLCQCTQNGEAVGAPVCSTSPRTAKLLCEAFLVAGPTSANCDDTEAEQLDELDSESPASGFQPSAPGEVYPVYCEDCWLWCNGPTQWEEHYYGKKHKKILRARPLLAAVARSRNE